MDALMRNIDHLKPHMNLLIKNLPYLKPHLPVLMQRITTVHLLLCPLSIEENVIYYCFR